MTDIQRLGAGTRAAVSRPRFINCFDFMFDTTSGKIYDPEGWEQEFTFVYVEGYNPMQFASAETAEKIKAVIADLVGPETVLTVVNDQDLIPAFSRFNVPQGRAVRVTDGNRSVDFNAGLIANSIMRSGVNSAYGSIMAELMGNGIAVLDPRPNATYRYK